MCNLHLIINICILDFEKIHVLSYLYNGREGRREIGNWDLKKFWNPILNWSWRRNYKESDSF